MRSKAAEIDAVRALVLLGEMLRVEVNSCSPEFLNSYRRYAWINLSGVNVTNRIAQSLSENDLCSLIIGTTYAERELSWLGGSFGAVSRLFKHLERTSLPSVYEPIADWVIANRGNPFIPYNTQMYIGTTHSECMEHKRQKERVDRDHGARLGQLWKDAQELQRTLADCRAMTARDRGSQIHKDIVGQLSKLPIVEQLTYIAADKVYSIGFYPKSIPASVTPEDVQKLGDEVIAELKEKLTGKAWGPWKKLKALLADVGTPASSYPSKLDCW
jgi:hypothetical protein